MSYPPIAQSDGRCFTVSLLKMADPILVKELWEEFLNRATAMFRFTEGGVEYVRWWMSEERAAEIGFPEEISCPCGCGAAVRRDRFEFDTPLREVEFYFT